MKTKKSILKVLLVITATCFFASCTSGTSSSEPQRQEEPFWEGQVQPGIYTGHWRVPSAGGQNEIDATLTIYDDRTVKYKTKEHILWGDYHTSIEVSTGYIYKYVETYDGERKVWYGIDTHPEPGSRLAQSMNISPSLEFGGGNCRTYQEYYGQRGQYGYLHKQ